MTEAELRAAIGACPKGANVYVEWERPVKLRTAYKGMPMTKFTRMLCRLGCDYDKIKETQDKRESGELPAQNAGLRGMEWDTFPTILKSIKTGALYLRLESGTFNVKAEREYRLDGQVVEFEAHKHQMLASEYPKPKDGHLTFNVNASQIKTIHNYEVATETETETEDETEDETKTA
jgi:hypothetical protein